MPQGWDGGTKGCVSVARGCPQVPIPTAHSHPPSVVPASPGPGTQHLPGTGRRSSRPLGKLLELGFFRLSPAHLHKQRGGEQACLFLLF